MLDPGWGPSANFYAFAVPALLGALGLFLVPRRAVASPDTAPVPA